MSEQGRTKGQSIWTDERIVLLTRLWAEGKSAGDIATAVGGGASRNAVIGKAGRLKLPPHSNTVKAHNHHRAMLRKLGPSKGGSNAPRPQARVFGETKVPMPSPKLALAGNGAVFERTGPAPEIDRRASSPWSPNWAPLPSADPVKLADRAPFTCRWPLHLNGEDIASHMCGLIAPGDRYCEHHAKRSAPAGGAKEHLDRKLGVTLRKAAA